MPPRQQQFHSAVTATPDTSIFIDGEEVPACLGDTVISALLRYGEVTGWSEFDGQERSGFCLMGACQDCTLWTATGRRLRACMTEVEPGMRLQRASSIRQADK